MRVRRHSALCAAIVSIVACHEVSEPTLREAGNVTAQAVASSGVITIDHAVPHISTLQANIGEQVRLFVRERVRGDVENRPREAVLFIHGRSVPVLSVAELRHEDYDWAGWLAQSGGFDVFMLDFQGSGRSPRPKMDDPCNAPIAQQALLIPNPLAASCPHSYPFTLNTSGTDLDELDTVIEYIRNLRGVDKVHLVAWSAGSFRAGPYAALHPDKVASVLFFAPIFNVNFRSPPPIADPSPMTLGRRDDLMGGWSTEIKCENQVEPGIQDVVWGSIMDNDDIGRAWGPPAAGAPPGSAPEGLMRVRQSVNQQNVWNASVAVRITAPTLIIRGELDTGQGGLQHVAELYNLVQNENKLRFTVQCGGHYMPWEKQRKVLHHFSMQWLKHQRVNDFSRGEFYVDLEGNLIAQ